MLQNRGKPDDLDIAVSAVKGGSAVRSRGKPWTALTATSLQLPSGLRPTPYNTLRRGEDASACARQSSRHRLKGDGSDARTLDTSRSDCIGVRHPG